MLRSAPSKGNEAEPVEGRMHHTELARRHQRRPKKGGRTSFNVGACSIVLANPQEMPTVGVRRDQSLIHPTAVRLLI